MFRIVSTTLEKYPAVRLGSLQWKHGHVGPVPSATAPASVPGTLSQSAVLQLELTAQPGDFRAALASINSFVRDLAKNENVADVKVIKMPLNLASNATLSGSTATQRQVQAQNAQFDIQVVLKPGV